VTEATFVREYHGVPFITSTRTCRTLDHVMQSEYDKYRHLPVAGRRVLDIGGFTGETAVLFHHFGATHVTIVEAVAENIALIHQNMALHHVSYDIVPTFVGRETGSREVRYRTIKGDFGLSGAWTKTAPHVRTMPVRAMSRVLSDVAAETVKCDCEGGEDGFLTTSDEVLRRASAYIVELHGGRLVREVTARFVAAGFAAVSTDEPRRRNQVVVFTRKGS
jgi:FkbM family methyltransferase